LAGRADDPLPRMNGMHTEDAAQIASSAIEVPE
jgi:hypothetical protein